MAEGAFTGRILKCIGGFYYVDLGGEIVECRARGRFRKDGVTPLAGDMVDISAEYGKGYILRVCERKNEFFRPPVANVDQMVIVASAAVPVTDPFLIDRIAVIAHFSGIVPIICVNKCDLARGDELAAMYRNSGIETILMSAATGEGMNEIFSAISGKVSAFTGNSGVGKSSILNMLEPALSLKTGEVSHKLGRGRHTTRTVELIRLRGGAVAIDTPGFSSFDADTGRFFSKEELEGAFFEFQPYLGKCRFQGCAHISDKDCAVRDAVDCGDISGSRYKSYVRLYEKAGEIKDWERKNDTNR